MDLFSVWNNNTFGYDLKLTVYSLKVVGSVEHDQNVVIS